MNEEKKPLTMQRKLGIGSIVSGSVLFLFDLVKFMQIPSFWPGSIDLVMFGVFLLGLLLGVGGVWGLPDKDHGWHLSFIGVFYVLTGWLLYNVITTFGG